MRYGILVLLFVAISAGAAEAPTAQIEVQPDGSSIIRLTAEQTVHCVENDGCLLLTPLEIAMVVQYMFEKFCRGEKTSVRR
jgi:hypothetical protein